MSIHCYEGSWMCNVQGHICCRCFNYNAAKPTLTNIVHLTDSETINCVKICQKNNSLLEHYETRPTGLTMRLRIFKYQEDSRGVLGGFQVVSGDIQRVSGISMRFQGVFSVSGGFQEVDFDLK